MKFTKLNTVFLIIGVVLLMMLFDSKCNNAKAQNPCDIYGSKKLQKFRTLDSLKNRNFSESGFDPSLTLEAILNFKGDDTKVYNSSQYVSLTGYVILVKAGGSETCNCGSSNPKDKDIHIEIALHPKDKAVNAMVCEINRYTQSDNPEFTLQQVRKKYLGKKVTIQGYLFLDAEHLQNAMTTNPTGKHNWRYSCWEIHPVMYMELSN